MISGTVAIVGRPNVGKSTIFNRLTNSMKALIDDQPGVTRDRIYGMSFYEQLNEDGGEDGFVVVDTGGFETKDLNYQPFSKNIVWQQTEMAIEEADVIILVFDGRAGLHPHDKELTRFLAKKNKEVIYAVNKLDGRREDAVGIDFYELGIDSMLFVTAAQNAGMDELRDAVREKLNARKNLRKFKNPDGTVNVAIIGRPNSGKSSLLNRLVGEERSLVSEIAGTTRDTVDAEVIFKKQTFVFVDTAGIRRRSKILDRVEALSIMRSQQAIEQADLVFLILDATQGFTDQDARLAQLAAAQFKPIVIVVNKWDLVKNKTSNSGKVFEEEIKMNLRLLAFVPVQFISCITNQRVHQLLELAASLSAMASKRVTTNKLNGALKQIVHEHTPAIIRKYSKLVKFYFATQVRIRPPTIVIFTNVADEIQESYRRYMSNKMRELLGFDQIPIRILYRSKDQQRSGKAAPEDVDG